MTESSKASPKPPVSATIAYFLLSLLAPWPLAWGIANSRIQAARMSNAKNIDEFTVFFQTAMWAGLMMLGVWVVYFALRRNDLNLRLMTLVLLIPSLSLIVQVLNFVL